jgi:hypothetical protein
MSSDKKRGAERTQKAVRDEDWSDERLIGFLALLPPDDLSADYNCLLRAYRGMTADLFARFVRLYVERGHDINVTLSKRINLFRPRCTAPKVGRLCPGVD